MASTAVWLSNGLPLSVKKWVLVPKTCIISGSGVYKGLGFGVLKGFRAYKGYVGLQGLGVTAGCLYPFFFGSVGRGLALSIRT